MNRTHKVKFFYVVFAFSVAIVLLSSAAISGVVYYRFDQTLSKQSDDFIRNTTAQLQSSIRTLMDNCETISGNLYANLPLQNFLESRNDSLLDYDLFEKFNAIAANLQSVMSSNKEIASITIYNLDPELVSNGKEIRHAAQFAHPDLLQQAIDARGANLWASYLDETTGAYKIVLMRYLNVFSPGGVLVIELNEASFYDLYHSGIGGNYLFLLDGSDRVISSNDRNAIGSPVAAPVASKLGGGAAVGKLELGDTRYYIYSDKVNAGWSLAVLYDSNEIEKEKRNIAVYVIVFTGALALFALLLAYLFSKRFSRRVGSLIFKIKEVDNGNLRIRPTISRVSEFNLLDQALCNMASNIDRLNSDILTVQKQKEESDRKYLQMQMNPHFLYNLLSVMRWIGIQKKHEEIVHIVDHLSDFYKIALSKGNDIIGIQDEIRLVRSYVELQNLSRSGRIRLAIRLDEQAAELKVCKMTLQPFVENSILHGWVHERELNIAIDIARLEGSGVRIRIADDGSGIEDDFIRLIEGLNGTDAMTSSASYGITNTVARLKYLYAGNVTISAQRQEPGTIIEIVILNAG